MKIKLFSSCHRYDIENFVNDFIKYKEVIDIKYSVSGDMHYAMIIYKEKKNED